MSTTELLEQLHGQDVRLWAEDGRLRYNAPPGALTPDLREQIVAHKAEILAFLHDAQPDGASAPIQPAARDRGLPLAFAQQRLWFLDRFEPGSPAYNLPAAVRLVGTLDVNALLRSLNAIMRRHEALRTTFALVDEQPIQLIAPVGADDELPLPLPATDLRGMPEAARATEARRLMAEEGRRPFDLAHGPLLRAALLRLGENEHILLLTMHHIVSDGWSLGVLVSEYLALYAGFVNGNPASLPELPIQYADFAVWQREQLQGAVLESQLAYWKEQLGGSIPVLDLPADHPRPAAMRYLGAHESALIPTRLAATLKALSQREGVTLFMTLLAAFKILLYRYTGQTDLLVGTPIANRTRPELEGLIGCFVNTLVLRTSLAGNPGFRELLARVREVTLGAYAHQDLPFEKLVEELQPERNINHAPLFQVMFILQNAPMPDLQLPGLTMELIELERGTANFDLTLSIEEVGTELRATLEYNSDLFESATIRRMLGHFTALLESIAAAPEQPITSLELLPVAERDQVLLGWNDTQAAYPDQLGLHQLIEAQASRTPHNVAVCCEHESLTYQELDQRANQLARFLRRCGVGPNVLVGICVERSLEMLVGLLGILKAGGAYIPLDPAYPQERLAWMLEDAQPPVLLTQQQLLAGLPAHQAQVICLDADWAMIAAEPAEQLENLATPEHLAYVIYTSGSTGRPKGVQIPHHAVVNFMSSMRREPGLDKRDTLLAVTTLSFDIAALELFLPLTVGARLVIASRTDAADGARLRALLDRFGATVMQATPATWRLLLAANWRSSPRLKMLCGGEALSRDLADQLVADEAELWNMYGPTETTIWSVITRVRPGDGPIVIGRPIANTTVYLLDSHLQPVPLGMPGELYIGGVGLSCGYLNRPELTTERFVPDPFAKNQERAPAGSTENQNNAQALCNRLYRTGDLARALPDGMIECLGRIDQQVKLRGYRIELGEIESILSQHPAVHRAVALVREDVPDDRRLVAYIVLTTENQSLASVAEPTSFVSASSDAQPSLVADLRAFLKQRLPDYMLPAAFVTLVALPLTPNGKVDRRALPPPDGLRPELAASYRAPQSGVERTIAEVWQAVLRVAKVGVNDNFFELGGHSLLMVQVHVRLQELFQQEFSMIELFKYPTISTLAGYIRRPEGAQVPPANDLIEKLLDGKQRLKQRLRQRQHGES